MTIRCLKALLASALLSVCLSQNAQAATFTIGQQNADNLFADAGGNNAWARSVNVSLTGLGSFDTTAGMFRLTADDGNEVQNFLAFCVDLLKFTDLPNPYADTLTFSSQVLSRIGALVTNAFPLVGGRSSAAGFQVALWEIVYDGDGSLNLGAGNFTLNSAETQNTVNNATNWLANISSGTWLPGPTVDFVLLESEISQNLLALNLDVPPPPPPPSGDVPLPAPLLMLLTALGALAGLKRVKRA